MKQGGLNAIIAHQTQRPLLVTVLGQAYKWKSLITLRTASWGSSREARQYREAQRELIEGGDFRAAQQMDIDDLQEKFGDKYDDAIQGMKDYTDELEDTAKL